MSEITCCPLSSGGYSGPACSSKVIRKARKEQTFFVEGALRGSSLTVAVLAYIAAARGPIFAEKVVLAASDLKAADELAAIIVSHASSSTGVDALQSCAAEVLAWVERGN